MPKAILFTIPSSGHTNPTIPVMQELAQTDLEIVYVNAERERAKVEATGTRFIAYPPDEQFNAFFDNVTTDNFSANALALYRIARRLMPFVLDLIERENPDFTIFDSLASWGKIGAQITSKPSLGFVTTFVITPDAAPSFPLKTVAMMVPQLLVALPPYALEMWQMWQTYKVKPLFIFDILMCISEYNIVFTSRELQPSGHKLPQTFQFTGAAIGKRTDDPEFPFDALRDDLPKIYISLGTIARNDDFLKRCFAAFGEMPVQVILSAGKQTDTSKLGIIPDNFIVRNFIPQLDILARVDVFVTHSGLNSVHEALLAGIPMIAIPQQPEQGMVAAQIDQLGAGIGLQLVPPFGGVSIEELRESLQKILDDPHYAQNAKKLGMGLREAGGIPRVVDLLQQFAQTHKLSM